MKQYLEKQNDLGGILLNDDILIIVFDVQHGNAIYMKSPLNKHMFFDIGSGTQKDAALSVSPLLLVRNNFEIDKIDYLLISHPHADHISDIPNLLSASLGPKVLSRPKNISDDFIKESNRASDSQLIDEYLNLDKNYSHPVTPDIDPTLPLNNGGVTIKRFCANLKDDNNINNYSILTLIEYGNDKVILPGDMESNGWTALLQESDFKEAIKGTTILVASHHGRESGYCPELFDIINPEITIISDGKYCDTSATELYINHTSGFGIRKPNSEDQKQRKVLSTRKDGNIYISITDTNKIILVD